MKSFNKTFFINESHEGQMNGFCILKPEFLDHEDDFLKMLTNNGWQIVQKDRRTLTDKEAQELYKMHAKKDFYNDLCKYMSSGDCLCCSCYKDCKDPIKDMQAIKDKVRSTWGKDEMKNGMHSSDSIENVNRETKLIFEKKVIEGSQAFDDLYDLADELPPAPAAISGDCGCDCGDDIPSMPVACPTCQQEKCKACELGISMNDDEFEMLKGMLTDALAEEFNAWYAYTIIIPFLNGPLRPEVSEVFKDAAKDELEDHAYWLMERLNQLGIDACSLTDPAFWNTTATHKYIYPSVDVIGAIQNNIRAEQGAIETYTKIEEFTRDRDVVTNSKIKEILKDEQEHLSELYDLRKDITGY